MMTFILFPCIFKKLFGKLVVHYKAHRSSNWKIFSWHHSVTLHILKFMPDNYQISHNVLWIIITDNAWIYHESVFQLKMVVSIQIYFIDFQNHSFVWGCVALLMPPFPDSRKLPLFGIWTLPLNSQAKYTFYIRFWMPSFTHN